MKKLFFPLLSFLLLTAFLFLSACSVPREAGEDLNDSYLMHVECTESVSTRNEVLLLLKRGRARDVRVDDVGGTMTIEAAYYKNDNNIGLLESIADDLRLMSTVVGVEIRDNPRMVRQLR